MSTVGVGGNDQLEQGKRWRGMEGTNSEPLNQANASGSRMISIIVSRLLIDSPLRT